MLEWQASSLCLTPLLEDLINCKYHHSHFSGGDSERCPGRSWFWEVKCSPPSGFPSQLTVLRMWHVSLRAVLKNTLGKSSLHLLTEWHQIICSVFSPWIAPLTCLKGDSENGLKLSCRITISVLPYPIAILVQKHNMSDCDFCPLSTPYNSIFLWTSSAGECQHILFLPPYLAYCHASFHCAEMDIAGCSLLSFPSHSLLPSSLQGTVLVFYDTLLSETWKRN